MLTVLKDEMGRNANFRFSFSGTPVTAVVRWYQEEMGFK
jgi:hypothetical protein